jgi:hypothetical protein
MTLAAIAASVASPAPEYAVPVPFAAVFQPVNAYPERAMFPTAATAGVAPTDSPVTAGGTEPVIDPTGLFAT